MKIVNIMNAIGITCSTIVCLASRLLYQKHILNKLSLGQLAIRRQKLYSLLIGFSSGCRLACVTMNVMGIDYGLFFRNFNQECLDVTPYNAILAFSITACIDLLPVFIFNIIFSTVSGKKKSYASIKEYLCKNNDSVRQV